MQHLLLTKKEAEKILMQKEGKIEVSLDLGLSYTSIEVREGFVLIKYQKISLEEFQKLKDDSCYVIANNHLQKLAIFSGETNIYYKLVPTEDWPTITFSSTPMHRHFSISPKQDTMLKIREIIPVKGVILDTCCGLGYTAIMAAEKSDEVYSFEKDKNVLALAKFNPYSSELFTNKKIKLFNEDIFEAIKNFRDSFFDRIIHDPPTFKLSPFLYSKNFYFELFRTLKKGGIIYHYAPQPGKTKNRRFHSKVVSSLKEAGFNRVEYKPRASGIRAVKI